MRVCEISRNERDGEREMDCALKQVGYVDVERATGGNKRQREGEEREREREREP